MMLSIKHLLSLLLLLFLGISCYSPRYVYSSPAQNIPALEKKHDVIVSASYAPGIGGKRVREPAYNHGLDLHLAYAYSKNWGVMINQFYRWEKNEGDNDFSFLDSSVLRYKRSLTEMGIGYFTSINEDSSSYFQFFAGGAIGKFSIMDAQTENGVILRKFHNSNVSKLFIQPALTFRHRKNYSAALSSRFTAVYYSKIKTNYTNTELENYILDSLSVSPVFFWEPAMNFIFSSKKINGLKLQVQLATTVLLNSRFIDSKSVNVGIGIVADVCKLLGKRKRAG